MARTSFLSRVSAGVFLASAVLHGSVQAAPVDQLLDSANAEVPAYLETLKAPVLTESGSGDAKGLEAMAHQLEGRLADLGFTTERRRSDASVMADTVVGVKTGPVGKGYC